MTAAERAADRLHYVLDMLESYGPMTRGELIAASRNDDACDRLTPTAICDALDRAVGLCLVREDDHEDVRARDGGCPPMFRLAGGAS